jgi:hypothetical protein
MQSMLVAQLSCCQIANSLIESLFERVERSFRELREDHRPSRSSPNLGVGEGIGDDPPAAAE